MSIRGLSRLRELARRGKARREQQPRSSHAECDLCAEPVAEPHRHLLDVTTGELSCVCTACGIRFDEQVPGDGPYRLIRSKSRELDVDLDDVTWASLGAPVDLAFFVRNGGSGEVTTFYPSASGAAMANPDPVAWRRLIDRNPEVACLESDVEALLVYRGNRSDGECWLAPIDECYRLMALFRSYWTGFSDCSQVWRHVDAFFEGMRADRE